MGLFNNRKISFANKEEELYFNNLMALSTPEDSVSFFTHTVGILLEKEIFQDKKLENINIHVSPYLYLQLKNHWGVDFMEFLEDDPIYSRIHIDSKLTMSKPIFIYYK